MFGHLNRKLRIRVAVPLAAASLIGACSSSTAPLILDERNSDRLLARDCKNVAKDQVVGDFRTDLYMTTGSSVLREAWKSEFPSNEIVTVGSTILGRMPPENTFCMVYGAKYDDVNSAVSAVINSLDLTMASQNTSSGEYETEFLYRAPPADLPFRNPNLKWREKYLIYVSENLVHGTDVRVYRDIAIAREPASTEKERRYYPATSIGQNESWILLRINDNLN